MIHSLKHFLVFALPLSVMKAWIPMRFLYGLCTSKQAQQPEKIFTNCTESCLLCPRACQLSWGCQCSELEILQSLIVDASRLGGVVASVLAAGPKGRGLKPGSSDGFLRAIKIRSTPSFGWEVKPEAPCRKILRHVKNLLYE
jgi:hypothetical protein